jgi:transposase-like protein
MPPLPDATDVPPFAWSKKRERAARLVAEDKLSDAQIAGELGIAKMTLERWKRHPEFRKRVDQHVEAYKAACLKRGIAQRERRVEVLNDLWERMQQVIAERAEAPEVQEVAGGKTGLITRTLKGIGKGEDFQVVEVFEVDTGLLRELREHQRQAAQELGQWTEKRETTTHGTVTLKHDVDQLRDKDPDELLELYRQALCPPEEDRG